MPVAYWVKFRHVSWWATWHLSCSTLPSPSIQFSFPHLPKFCPAIGPKQFLYSLMVIIGYRGIRGEPTITLLNSMVLNLLLMVYPYTHILMHPSSLLEQLLFAADGSW